jgi:hypothetical protein
MPAIAVGWIGWSVSFPRREMAVSISAHLSLVVFMIFLGE